MVKTSMKGTNTYEGRMLLYGSHHHSNDNLSSNINQTSITIKRKQ